MKILWNNVVHTYITFDINKYEINFCFFLFDGKTKQFYYCDKYQRPLVQNQSTFLKMTDKITMDTVHSRKC